MTPRLIISADDYGYAPGYDRGILEAARAGAIDAASAMVLRRCDPAPLLDTGTEIGLHLEIGRDAPRAEAEHELGRQLLEFERLFKRPPAFIDGHHHCHAMPHAAAVVAGAAAAAGIPVRSVSEGHRSLLRAEGVATPDLLVGRLGPEEPARPAELDRLPGGVTEWMVHPGHADPAIGSAFDAEREEDLALLLAFRLPEGVSRVRHSELLPTSVHGRDSGSTGS